jgi:hypothetical protein
MSTIVEQYPYKVPLVPGTEIYFKTESRMEKVFHKLTVRKDGITGIHDRVVHYLIDKWPPSYFEGKGGYTSVWWHQHVDTISKNEYETARKSLTINAI